MKTKKPSLHLIFHLRQQKQDRKLFLSVVVVIFDAPVEQQLVADVVVEAVRRRQVFPKQAPADDPLAADPAAKLDVGVNDVVVVDQRRRRLEQLPTKNADNFGVDGEPVIVSDVLGQLAREVEDQRTFPAQPRLFVLMNLSVFLP